MSKLGIILVFFGDDELRIKSAKRALEEFKKQTIWKKSKIVFVELIKNNTNFIFESNIIHIKIKEEKLNENLFQKECLWNIGAKKIEKEVDNFIFIDVDTFPQDIELFEKANEALSLNHNVVFQLGNCIITQKDDGTITRVQWLWNSFSKLEAQKSYCFNPCGGFAISKKIYNQIDGFNPYGFLYGGDILFLYEIDKRTHKIWSWIINNLDIFKERTRNVNNENITIDNEESPLIHCWHGNHKDRPYHVWGQVFNKLEFNKDEIKLDENNLLSWKNEETLNKYKKFFQNKHLIKNINKDINLYK